MSTSTVRDNAPATQRGRTAVGAGVALAGLTWLVGTPVLAYGAFITSASFFGEPPSASQMTTAMRLLAAAGVCGVVVPAIAAVVAWRQRWRRTAWLFAALSAGTIAAAVWLQAALA